MKRSLRRSNIQRKHYKTLKVQEVIQIVMEVIVIVITDMITMMMMKKT